MVVLANELLEMKKAPVDIISLTKEAVLLAKPGI